jgi:hypothetical protein
MHLGMFSTCSALHATNVRADWLAAQVTVDVRLADGYRSYPLQERNGSVPVAVKGIDYLEYEVNAGLLSTKPRSNRQMTGHEAQTRTQADL